LLLVRTCLAHNKFIHSCIQVSGVLNRNMTMGRWNVSLTPARADFEPGQTEEEAANLEN
jgi:hypothetical protein